MAAKKKKRIEPADNRSPPLLRSSRRRLTRHQIQEEKIYQEETTQEKVNTPNVG